MKLSGSLPWVTTAAVGLATWEQRQCWARVQRWQGRFGPALTRRRSHDSIPPSVVLVGQALLTISSPIN